MYLKPFTEAQAQIWMTANNAEAIAFLYIWQVGDDIEIIDMGVRAAHRRRGIAETLLAELGNHARLENCKSLHLDVSINNHAARKLYAKYGFIETGRRSAYYQDGSDALLMTVDLI